MALSHTPIRRARTCNPATAVVLGATGRRRRDGGSTGATACRVDRLPARHLGRCWRLRSSFSRSTCCRRRLLSHAYTQCSSRHSALSSKASRCHASLPTARHHHHHLNSSRGCNPLKTFHRRRNSSPRRRRRHERSPHHHLLLHPLWSPAASPMASAAWTRSCACTPWTIRWS